MLIGEIADVLNVKQICRLFFAKILRWRVLQTRRAEGRIHTAMQIVRAGVQRVQPLPSFVTYRTHSTGLLNRRLCTPINRKLYYPI